MVLKHFLCSAVMGMLLARQETAVKRFYQKKLKQIGQAKAQVAAARKLSAVVCWVLTHRETYREQDEELTERKMARLDRAAESPPTEVTPEDLERIGTNLSEKAEILERLIRESDTSRPGD
jgi:triosephosphate isomerase